MMEEVTDFFMIRVELAERGVFNCKVGQESLRSKSSRQVLCLYGGLVQLVHVVPTGSPEEVWPGQRHELRLEILERGKLDRISVCSQLCLPIVEDIKLNKFAK